MCFFTITMCCLGLGNCKGSKEKIVPYFESKTYLPFIASQNDVMTFVVIILIQICNHEEFFWDKSCGCAFVFTHG